MRPGMTVTRSVLILLLGVIMTACAGGLVGGKEAKLAYFEKLESETLARLIKEYPKTERQLAQSVSYAVIDKKTVKVPGFGAAAGAGVVMDKAANKRSYLRVPEVQFGAGWGGRVEKIILIFQNAAKLRDLADGQWTAGVGAEAAVKAADVGVAGSEGSADSMKEGVSTYVLTDAGASATATINFMRAQPYSID